MEPSDIEFSDGERHVLQHFRPSAAGKWRRGAIFDLSFIIISLILAALCVVYRDPGVGFVAYALVLWRAWVAFRQRRRYSKIYQSIFSKYEARIQKLGSRPVNEPKV